jgi:hypothetical protein
MTSRQKRLWIFAGIFLFIVIIVLVGINSYLGFKIKEAIGTEINNNPDSTLIINYSDIDINIYTGFIRINDLVIEPGNEKTNSFHQGNIKSLFSIKIASFSVSGVHVLDFLTEEELKIGKVKVKDADIDIIVNNSLKAVNPNENKGTLQIFSGKLKGISVKKILLKDINLTVSDIKKEKDPYIKLNSLSISINGVNVDSTTIRNPIPASFESIIVETKEFIYSAPEYYSMNFSGLNFTLQDSTLKIANFQLKPKYSRTVYNKKISYENDLFDISTKAVIIHRIGLQSFISNKELNIPLIEVIHPDIDIYRNKRLPDAPYKYKPLLGSLIKKIPIPVLIDTLKIENGKLVYGELHQHRDTPGEVEFNKLDIIGYNITNQKAQTSLHPEMRLDINALFMGKAKLQVNFKFDQSKANDYFTVRGEMGRINATEINRVSESMMMVKIKSGDIKKASFNFTANDDESNGILKLDYKNLSVDVLKREKNKKYITLSLFANGLIKHNNTPEGKKYKTGLIRFSRNKNKALPNYLWKSIQSGLVSIIASVAESKEQKEIQKAEKEEKKKNKKEKNKKKGKK